MSQVGHLTITDFFKQSQLEKHLSISIDNDTDSDAGLSTRTDNTDILESHSWNEGQEMPLKNIIVLTLSLNLMMKSDILQWIQLILVTLFQITIYQLLLHRLL